MAFTDEEKEKVRAKVGPLTRHETEDAMELSMWEDLLMDEAAALALEKEADRIQGLAFAMKSGYKQDNVAEVAKGVLQEARSYREGAKSDGCAKEDLVDCRRC